MDLIYILAISLPRNWHGLRQPNRKVCTVLCSPIIYNNISYFLYSVYMQNTVKGPTIWERTLFGPSLWIGQCQQIGVGFNRGKRVDFLIQQIYHGWDISHEKSKVKNPIISEITSWQGISVRPWALSYGNFSQEINILFPNPNRSNPRSRPFIWQGTP